MTMVSESLRKQIYAAERAGLPITLTISDSVAWELAGELAAMQMMPSPASQAELYEGMKAGTSKFMDRPLLVDGAKGRSTL